MKPELQFLEELLWFMRHQKDYYFIKGCRKTMKFINQRIEELKEAKK